MLSGEESLSDSLRAVKLDTRLLHITAILVDVVRSWCTNYQRQDVRQLCIKNTEEVHNRSIMMNEEAMPGSYALQRYQDGHLVLNLPVFTSADA